MRFKMSQNSLFAYLLRSPAWFSFAFAVALAFIGRFFLSDNMAFYAFSFAIPFVIIGSMVIWKRRGLPSAARVSSTVEAVAAMSWREFSQLMRQAFEREGYVVSPCTGAADFRLVKGGRTALVSCKRWKAASHGIEPLRDLYATRDAQEANDALYVAVGDLTENALSFAQKNRIKLIQGPELTLLLHLRKAGAKVPG